MNRTLYTAIMAFFSTSVFGSEPSIGSSNAVPHQVVSKEKISEPDDSYIFSCVTSDASGKEERAHTMVKAVTEIQNESPGMKIALYLAPDKKLCQEGRLIGQTYYSPAGNGWKGIVKGTWTWAILTTDKQVSDQEIKDTVLYESKKTEFKTKFGLLDYSEKLDEHMKKQLGREPEYVTSGIWVDTYHVE